MNDSDDITADKADPVESNDPDGKLCPIEQHDLRADMAEAPTAAERAQDLARALNQRVPCCILLEQESLIAAAICVAVVCNPDGENGNLTRRVVSLRSPRRNALRRAWNPGLETPDPLQV